jgi:hypothetical protein
MIWSLFTTTGKGATVRRSSRRLFSPLKVEELVTRSLPSATTLSFAVDPTASSVSLSGTVNYLGSHTIEPQGTGSLTTTYEGTVAANYDPADGDNGSLQFVTTGTSVTADNSGNWQPKSGGASGSEAANYGGKASVFLATAYVAVRNLAFNLSTSSALSLSATGGFTSNQTMTTTAGVADYNLAGLGSGQTKISGQSATNNASDGLFEILTTPGDYRVTVPIHFTLNETFSGGSATLTVDGSIQGVAHIPVVTLNDGSNPGTNNYATTWVAGGGPVNLTDPNAAINSAVATQLSKLVVTITNPLDGTDEVLAANVAGTGLTATYDATTGTLTITGNANLATYISVLQSITYDNATGTAGDRFITFVATDTLGNQSLASTVDLTI